MWFKEVNNTTYGIFLLKQTSTPEMTWQQCDQQNLKWETWEEKRPLFSAGKIQGKREKRVAETIDLKFKRHLNQMHSVSIKL